MTIIEALRDTRLFGALPAFRKLSSWEAWLTFLKATYGLPLTASEVEIFRRHTGRLTYRPPRGGWREVVAIVGRQSGKSRIAATVAAFEAVRARGERDGTETYALLVAQDQRAALRMLFQYARATFESVPALQQSVTTSVSSSLTLENGVVVSAYPCRPAAVRGLRARVVVLDELSFYRSSENLPIDREMLRAVRPCLATTGGKLVVLSSPYGQSGALWDLHWRHYGRDDASVLIWQASAPTMNPTLSQDYLQRMAQDDPEAYRSEVLGEFRAGASTLLDADALAACVAAGVGERGPEPGRVYASFADPASGSGTDAFTEAIAHMEGERVVLDVIRAWRPPFNPSGVIAEAAELLSRYGLSDTTGDRYAPGFVSEGFRANGVSYHPDDPELLRELRGLERRRGTSGRDRVDHGPGQHDDRANAAAGALVSVLATSGRMSPESIDNFFRSVLAGRRRSPWRGGGNWGWDDDLGPSEEYLS